MPAHPCTTNTPPPSNVRFDPASRLLTFASNRLGLLALVISRHRLLPFRSWDLRPTGGLGGNTVALTLHAAAAHASLQDPLVIEAGPAWVRLVAPCLPELAGLIGVRFDPWQLLQRLSDAGLNLLPDDGGEAEGEAAPLAAGRKHAATERAMCRDVARIW